MRHARRWSGEAHRTPAAGGRGRKRPGGDRPDRPRADGSVLTCLTALDRSWGPRDDLVCRPGSDAAAGPPALRLVVLWAGHRLHDDVFGSGDHLCAADRTPADPVV